MNWDRSEGGWEEGAGESWGGGVKVMGVFNFGRKSQTAIGYEHVKPPTQKLYTVSQKGATTLMIITLLNVNRFSRFFQY
jgi:hypothetical protein